MKKVVPVAIVFLLAIVCIFIYINTNYYKINHLKHLDDTSLLNLADDVYDSGDYTSIKNVYKELLENRTIDLGELRIDYQCVYAACLLIDDKVGFKEEFDDLNKLYKVEDVFYYLYSGIMMVTIDNDDNLLLTYNTLLEMDDIVPDTDEEIIFYDLFMYFIGISAKDANVEHFFQDYSTHLTNLGMDLNEHFSTQRLNYTLTLLKQNSFTRFEKAFYVSCVGEDKPFDGYDFYYMLNNVEFNTVQLTHLRLSLENLKSSMAKESKKAENIDMIIQRITVLNPTT